MYFFFLPLIIVSLVFPSCNDTSGKAKTAQPSGTSTNSITFKANGVAIKTGGWNISRFNMGNGVQLNITSDMHKDKRTVSFTINGAMPGIYSLQKDKTGNGTAYGSYKPDYEDLLNSYSFQDGEVSIISIDTARRFLNATFKGTAKNSSGEAITITEGKITDGIIRPGILTY